MERIVKIGIIGCGGIANGKHMPALSRIPNVKMVAFCDLIPERAEKARTKYGTPDAKVYVDYKELLKDEEIRLFTCSLPTASTHKSPLMRSMQASTLCVKSRWQKLRQMHAACTKRLLQPAKS